MSKRELTGRQREVFDFIHTQMSREFCPPTRAEIAQRFGFKSANAAQCHLEELASRGWIELAPGKSRGIRLMPGGEGE